MKKFGIAVLTALTLGGAFMALAQDKTQNSYFPDSLVQDKKALSADMCRQMMAEKVVMSDTQMAMDRKIDLLVKAMNETTGESRASATAAVVSELVLQRHSMGRMGEKMGRRMQMHMMQHAKDGKMNCPMMGGQIPPN